MMGLGWWLAVRTGVGAVTDTDDLGASFVGDHRHADSDTETPSQGCRRSSSSSARRARQRSSVKRASQSWTALLCGCLAAAGVLGGCGSNGDGPNGSVDAAVIAGWKAALNAADTAARTSDPNSPGLAMTFVQPELGIAKKNLANARSGNAVAVGSDRVIRVRVMDVSGNEAKVAACVDGGEIFIDALTRKPVPGVLGEAGLEGSNATMVLRPSGWKIEQQAVNQGRCP